LLQYIAERRSLLLDKNNFLKTFNQIRLDEENDSFFSPIQEVDSKTFALGLSVPFDPLNLETKASCQITISFEVDSYHIGFFAKFESDPSTSLKNVYEDTSGLSGPIKDFADKFAGSLDCSHDKLHGYIVSLSADWPYPPEEDLARRGLTLERAISGVIQSHSLKFGTYMSLVLLKTNK
jgi:hypothetical protein